MTSSHCVRLRRLRRKHRDPFDFRMFSKITNTEFDTVITSPLHLNLYASLHKPLFLRCYFLWLGQTPSSRAVFIFAEVTGKMLLLRKVMICVNIKEKRCTQNSERNERTSWMCEIFIRLKDIHLRSVRRRNGFFTWKLSLVIPLLKYFISCLVLNDPFFAQNQSHLYPP